MKIFLFNYSKLKGSIKTQSKCITNIQYGLKMLTRCGSYNDFVFLSNFKGVKMKENS